MRRVEQLMRQTSLTFTARTVFQHLQQLLQLLQQLPLAAQILLQEPKLLLALAPLQVHYILLGVMYQYQYLLLEYYFVSRDNHIPL